jgi:hypothetical protein
MSCRVYWRSSTGLTCPHAGRMSPTPRRRRGSRSDRWPSGPRLSVSAKLARLYDSQRQALPEGRMMRAILIFAALSLLPGTAHAASLQAKQWANFCTSRTRKSLVCVHFMLSVYLTGSFSGKSTLLIRSIFACQKNQNKESAQSKLLMLDWPTYGKIQRAIIDLLPSCSARLSKKSGRALECSATGNPAEPRDRRGVDGVR